MLMRLSAKVITVPSCSLIGYTKYQKQNSSIFVLIYLISIIFEFKNLFIIWIWNLFTFCLDEN